MTTSSTAAIPRISMLRQRLTAEKRKRVAELYLEEMRAAAKREKEEEGDDYVDERGGREDGDRDSMVARMLQSKQLEDSGRVRKLIAARVQSPKTT